MPIEKVRDFFGIKYVIPYNLTTKKPLVVLRAVGEISFENKVDAVNLIGGHTEAPYDTEYGQPEPTLKGTVREYPSELFQIMETCTVTDVAAQPSGNVGTVTNGQGTSVFKSPGITSVTVSGAISLVFGQYVLVALTSTTLGLYINGLSDNFLDMQANVVATITTTTAGSVAVAAAGITLTVTGTPNYTVGDTAYFEVQPINTGSKQVLVGTGTVPTTFGVRCIFPRKSDGVLHYIDIFQVAARGMSWKGVSREFSEFEINWTPQARSSDGAIYQMVRVLGS